MNKKSAVTVAFLLLFPLVSLYADDTKKHTDDTQPAPASREEVLKLQKAVKDLHRSLQKSEVNAVKRSDEIVRQNKSAVSAAEQRIAEELTRNTAVQNRMAAERNAQARKELLLGIAYASVLVALVIGSFVVVFRIKNNKAKTTGTRAMEIVKMVEPGAQERPWDKLPLFDPNVSDIRMYAQQNEDASEVPFILALPEQKSELRCTAVLLAGDRDPLVRFVERKDLVTWEKRRKVAKQILQQRNAAAS